MKKYHHSPTLGVRSGSNRCTPYVEYRNSHEFEVMKYDSPSNPAIAARNIPVCVAAKLRSVGFPAGRGCIS
jgi:hypothetical protein